LAKRGGRAKCFLSTPEDGGLRPGDDVAEYVEAARFDACEDHGCPKCASHTECCSSRSAAFPDGSLYVEVLHYCAPCDLSHTTGYATGDLARQFAADVATASWAEPLVLH
jgi:hypothetical protein